MLNLSQENQQSIRDFVSEIDQAFVNAYGRSYGWNLKFNSFRRRTKINCLLNGMKPAIYAEMRKKYVNNEIYFTWNDLAEAAQDAEWLCSLRYRESNFVGSAYPRYNDEGFQVDGNGHVIVYTDGACFRNGQPDAQAGIGVWFGNRNYWNVSEPLDEWDPVTNNVAEIRAAIEALEIAKNCGVKRLAIYTDSMFLIETISNWMYTWLANGWIKSDGEDVKHKVQFRDLLFAMEDMDVKWVHVNSHSNHVGNIEADALAREGAEQYYY